MINSEYETLNKYHSLSIANPNLFWRDRAKLIEWFDFPKKILDKSKPPFSTWFSDGTTNLCFNAVDRHLSQRGNQKALIFLSTESNEEESYSYNELLQRISYFCNFFIEKKLTIGDRVIIYMPMLPEAVFAMLACARLGLIHSVVFGGFAANALALRIKDASPKLIITCDASSRNGKLIGYKEILDQAQLQLDNNRINTLVINRGLVEFKMNHHDIAIDRKNYFSTEERNIPECEKLSSLHPSYILYTSGTTGSPKGIQRDTGGYAVALASSMQYIFNCKPGEVFFCASDIGWVVGHSYLVYGPLVHGCTTILYEGIPTKPNSDIWWSMVEKYSVKTMFTSPTAIRVLKKDAIVKKQSIDTSSLKTLFLAGEPLDTGTSSWIGKRLPKTEIVDNYWQTETGWPILSAQFGIEKTKIKQGSPSFPVFGYDVDLINDGRPIKGSGEKKGMLCLRYPLPPGSLQTIWNNDKRFKDTYFFEFNSNLYYKTFDFAEIDEKGYFYILGRTDDVINVAGHRIGTREIEEAIQLHEMVAEAAVIGTKDKLKGQTPVAFVVKKNITQEVPVKNYLQEEESDTLLKEELEALISEELGRFAKPSMIYFVLSLPKTRSGKLLRRVMQALCDGEDVGDITTIEEEKSLGDIKKVLPPRRQ